MVLFPGSPGGLIGAEPWLSKLSKLSRCQTTASAVKRSLSIDCCHCCRSTFDSQGVPVLSKAVDCCQT